MKIKIEITKEELKILRLGAKLYCEQLLGKQKELDIKEEVKFWKHFNVASNLEDKLEELKKTKIKQ